MTTFLLPLSSCGTIIPPVVLFGVAPHYFAVRSSLHILGIFLPHRIIEKIDKNLYNTYQTMVTYFFTKYCGTKVYFYGGKIDADLSENVLYISNHQATIDWSLANFVAFDQGEMGKIRYIMKDLLKYLPFYGLYFMQHGCVFVKTKGNKTPEEDLHKKLVKFVGDRVDGYWLVIFPEGTRFSSKKKSLIEKSNVVAREAGLEPLENVLCPKTKGFELCLEHLTNLDAIYDVTVAFKIPWLPLESKQEGPSLLEFVSVYGREVHIHLRRINAKNLPKGRENVKDWIYSAFQNKDELLKHFYDPLSGGAFPGVRRDMRINKHQVLPCALLHSALLVITLSLKPLRKLYFQISLVGFLGVLFTPVIQRFTDR